MEKGLVYILYDHFNKISRIGKTKHNTNRIESQLAYYHSSLIWTKAECEDYHNVEKLLHARFSNRRKKGDWFYISPVDFVTAIMTDKSIVCHSMIMPIGAEILRSMLQCEEDNAGIGRNRFDRNRYQSEKLESIRQNSKRKNNRNDL